jgi:hypothetical protein
MKTPIEIRRQLYLVLTMLPFLLAVPVSAETASTQKSSVEATDPLWLLLTDPVTALMCEVWDPVPPRCNIVPPTEQGDTGTTSGSGTGQGQP